MSLKDILVHVDDSPYCVHRLEAACGLANQHGAHLAAIYVAPPPAFQIYMTEAYLPELLIAEQEKLERERLARARNLFGKQTSRAGIKAEWRQRQGAFATTVSMNARYADLAIVSQGDPNHSFSLPELPADVALSAGRPVLVVPYVGSRSTIGANVLIGWNASREATRAVNDALPLLERANRVTVLAIDPEHGVDGHGDLPGADIGLHLARHSVKTETAETISGEIEVGDVLLSRASDLGADLIVVGAYGHSRMREFVMGGVTRHLLEHTTVPILMSH